jgi:hypothetical protein
MKMIINRKGRRRLSVDGTWMTVKRINGFPTTETQNNLFLLTNSQVPEKKILIF